MLTSAIISKFSLYVDDGTELSSAEELDLANKIYRVVCNFRPWEWLKAVSTNPIVNNAITLPSDFGYMSANNQSTDSSVNNEALTAPKVIFVGTNLTPVKLINFSDRRQYQNKNVAYINPTDSKIYFITTQTDSVAEFDYIKVPADLTLSTSPIFPAQFHDIIYHGMASDDYMIQQFDKARSYANENQAKYNSILKDMGFSNAMATFN